MSLTANIGIHFSLGKAGSDSKADKKDDTIKKLTLDLATKITALSVKTYQGEGLHTELTVNFEQQQCLCRRVSFLGPVQSGLPTMSLSNKDVSYAGSTCAYRHTRKWLVYSDFETDQDPELHLSFAAKNLSSLFNVPTGFNYSFHNDGTSGTDDDAGSTSQNDCMSRILPVVPTAEELGLEMVVASMEMHLPMRLMLNKTGTDSPFVFKERMNGDAPTFTGSYGRITCDEQPIFVIKNSEILQEIAKQDGEYDLQWRIYTGQGEIEYKLLCHESPLIGREVDTGTYTEKIGNKTEDGYTGGMGGSTMVDLCVATFLVRKVPLPFVDTSDTTEFGDEGNGYYEINREGECLFGNYKQSRWYGQFKGNKIILSWAGNQIYADGRLVLSVQNEVLCAGLRNDEILVYFTKSGTFIQMYHVFLVEIAPPTSDDPNVVIDQNVIYVQEIFIGEQKEPDEKAEIYVISPDGQQLATFRHATVTAQQDVYPRYHRSSSRETFDGGAVYVASIAGTTTERGTEYEFGDFTTKLDHRDLITNDFNVDIQYKPFGGSNCFYTSSYYFQHMAKWNIKYTLNWNAVRGIVWNNDNLETLVQKICFTCASDGVLSEVHSQDLISTGYEMPLHPLQPPMQWYFKFATSYVFTDNENIAYSVDINDDQYCSGKITSDFKKKQDFTDKSQFPYAITKATIALTKSGGHTETHDFKPTHYRYHNQDGVFKIKKGKGTIERKLDIFGNIAQGFFTETLTEGSDYDQALLCIDDNEIKRHSLSINNRAYDVNLSRAVVDLRPIVSFHDAYLMYTILTGKNDLFDLSRGSMCDPLFSPDESFRLNVRGERFFTKEMIWESICYTAKRYLNDTVIPVERYFFIQNLEQTCRMVSGKLQDRQGNIILNKQNIGNKEINHAHTDYDNLYAITPTYCLVRAMDAVSDTHSGAEADALIKPTVEDFIAAINRYRRDMGMEPVVSNTALTQAIEAHVLFLYENDPCATTHVGRNYSTIHERVVASGYDSEIIGELLAMQKATVADVIKTWKSSQADNTVLLDTRWHDVGVAIAECPCGHYYWGVNFGSQPASE